MSESRGDFKVAVETVERFGRQFRHFPVAVSAEAMALSWANTEQGPAGGAIVVDHEIGSRGFLGRVWNVPPARSVNLAVILRPDLPAEQGDATWLIAGLAALRGSADASGREVQTWWPDRIVVAAGGAAGGMREEVASLHSTIQLGPGKIKHAVITIHLDLAPLGLDASGRDGVVEAITRHVDELVALAEAEGTGVLSTAYSETSALIGKRVKVALRPKGETRGVVRHIDRLAHLAIESAGGMTERIGVDQLRELTVV